MDKNIVDLFESAIAYWPHEIGVGNKTLHESGGATIPELTAIHDSIESETLSKNLSDAHMRMDWAIYTIVHQLARNIDIVKPREIDMERVIEVYVENESEN